MKIAKIILGIPVVIFLGLLAGELFFGNQIRMTHTRFLFAQLGRDNEDYASLHGDSPHWKEFDEQEYLKFSRIQEKRNIDWNSCSVVDGKILDGWGQPCRIKCKKGASGSEFRYSSPGADGVWGSDDDIISLNE